MSINLTMQSFPQNIQALHHIWQSQGAVFPATSAHIIGFTSLYAEAVTVRLHVVSELGAGESSWWTGLTARAAEVRFLSQCTEGMQ